MYTTKAQICIRRDTAANFTSADPTLALGEIAYETDTRNLKVGDGATAWTALPYVNPYRAGTAAAPTSNTVLGSGAGAALQAGATDNVLIGSAAGDAITTGDECIVIGSGADVAAATNANSIVIGHGTVGNGSNTTTIGNSSTTGTFIPAGNLTLTNGNLILETSGNGISFAATSDPTIAAVAARGFITRTATNVANNDTVTIGTTVYTFKTTLTPANWEVLIGADASASLTNLRHAILGTGGTPGTDYQVPNAHPTVTASAISGSILPLVAITAGAAGNSIALAETSAELSVSAATLLGGRAAQGMTSELLDDYEVGTWTPQYFPQTGAFASIATEVSTATYVKIGKSVTINARINTDGFSIGTASGQIRISGLPYTPGGQTSGVTNYPGAARAESWGTNTPTIVTVFINSTIVFPSHRTSITGSDVFTSVTDLSTTSAGVDRNVLAFTVTYITS